VAYVINCDKRTVVALIQYDDGGGVAYRGIAKCAPGETFNSAIGKAIALHRALGIVVPAEYLNAPGPEIVRDGDVVRYNESSRGALTVREVAQNTSVETFLSTAQDHFDNLTVLDDSRDEDGGHSAASSALKGAA
jgi:thiamine biosynthesis protein ThiC